MNKLFKSVVIDEFNVDIHYDESISQDTYDALVKAMNDKGFKHTSNVPPAHAKLYSMRSHDLQAYIDGLKNAGRHEEAIPAQRILNARTKNITDRRDAARAKMKRFTMKSEMLKVANNGQWQIQKAGEAVAPKSMGHSSFTIDHVNQVATTKDHDAAKKIAHKAVDSSTANPKNKAKMKMMINSSRNTAHLAQGMSNYMLAHPSEGLKVVKDEDMNKADVKYAPSGRVPATSMPKGWTVDPKTGNFHHSVHGMIFTTHNPEKNRYEIKHGRRAIGIAANMNEAAGKIRNYVNSLIPGDTGIHNIDPMAVKKGDEHMDLTCSEEDKKEKKE
jgi:hypothetical protein